MQLALDLIELEAIFKHMFNINRSFLLRKSLTTMYSSLTLSRQSHNHIFGLVNSYWNWSTGLDWSTFLDQDLTSIVWKLTGFYSLRQFCTLTFTTPCLSFSFFLFSMCLEYSRSSFVVKLYTGSNLVPKLQWLPVTKERLWFLLTGHVCCPLFCLSGYHTLFF